jgi:hypothetical protein
MILTILVLQHPAIPRTMTTRNEMQARMMMMLILKVPTKMIEREFPLLQESLFKRNQTLG